MVAVLGCKGCGKCDNVCPFGAIDKVGKKTRINYDKCTGCLKCVECCPNKVLKNLRFLAYQKLLVFEYVDRDRLKKDLWIVKLSVFEQTAILSHTRQIISQ
ncbi:MAG: 4Fe-4S dicluster domain-containing protein [Candidatus Methanolliviera sp. GoM_asphalt]|nr:MAG: 4Fe-4S dicluster domain-containing protein [Candidatus Methanolliviera sp. GoM_asphalt]